MGKKTQLVELPLDRELTKGTTTLYLPLNRKGGVRPEVTVMLKPTPQGTVHLGMAVCSLNDQFICREGRRRAYHRLLGNPLVVKSGQELIDTLTGRLLNLRANRPGTVSNATLNDLYAVAEHVEKKKARPVLRVVR